MACINEGFQTDPGQKRKDQSFKIETEDQATDDSHSNTLSDKQVSLDDKLGEEKDQATVDSHSNTLSDKQVALDDKLGEEKDQATDDSHSDTFSDALVSLDDKLGEEKDQATDDSHSNTLSDKQVALGDKLGEEKDQAIDDSHSDTFSDALVSLDDKLGEEKDQAIDVSHSNTFSDKQVALGDKLGEEKDQAIDVSHSNTFSDKQVALGDKLGEEKDQATDDSHSNTLSDKQVALGDKLGEEKDQAIDDSHSNTFSDKQVALGDKLGEEKDQATDDSHSNTLSDKQVALGDKLGEEKDQAIDDSHSNTFSDKQVALDDKLGKEKDQAIDDSHSNTFSDKQVALDDKLGEEKDQAIDDSHSDTFSDKQVALDDKLGEEKDQAIDDSHSDTFSDKQVALDDKLGEEKDQAIDDSHSNTLSDKQVAPAGDFSGHISHSIANQESDDLYYDCIATTLGTFISHQSDQSLSTASPTAKDNELQSTLFSIGLKQSDIDFILDQGEKYLDKPTLLSRKLKISPQNAELIITALKDYKKSTVIALTPRDCRKIEECLKENPEFDSLENISLLCDIDETLVAAYFESKPLTETQKETIRQKYNAGYTVADIVNILRISNKKVQEYVECTFLTFTSEEGKEILDIIQKNFEKIQFSKLREMVISEDLKLQDQLCCILRERNETQYRTVEAYFNKFSESKSFFKVEMKLTIEDILYIKQCSSENIEQLSIRLRKVETSIRNYLNQYNPNQVVKDHQALQQVDQINNIVTYFGKDKLSFQTYRMIFSESFEDIIKNADKAGQTPRDAFLQLLPLSFYYLKCSLPLADITQMIANSSQITVTTHDVFHIIFQLSDPVLRGFCVEHYSFSNPVPLYYPLLISSSKSKETKFAICKELWYSMQQFNGLISFGLGRAGWNPIGKSHLLDLIFCTNFKKGNPSNSAFHLNSIDIQMTKNLFGEIEDKSSAESTKWAYIDCHGNSNKDTIRVLCQQLDIALVHVSSSDYSANLPLFIGDVHDVMRAVKHVYFLVRDCGLAEVEIESKQYGEFTVKTVFIPDLTKQDTKIYSVKKSLKEFGYEILHLNSKKIGSVGSDFLENVMRALDDHSWTEIQSNKELIQKITSHISKVVQSSSKIDFSFLSYYPLFVDYMGCYHNAANETDQKKIDELNTKSGKLNELLETAPMGNVVLYFNEILQRDNSTLILWKLSQQLFEFSKQTIQRITNIKPDSVIEQKNDKYTIEVLWREALLSNKYGNLSKEHRDSYNEPFAANFSNHVERGEAFELIDGDNLRFFNRDIDELLFNFYERQSKELNEINKGKEVQLKHAPIVVSIFGPQSSGKSTLLNYCFGCKFLTSAGRCTRGVYGSLSKLSRPINLTDHFLILDTEGLDAIERGNIQNTSMINFDRTMVLFCLAVSQVVIINVKGDLGSEMQNLLQICAYSLNKLKVRKVTAPKIFFVLNQQADPDPAKHLDSINILMDKLTKESDLMDTEGIKISDLIQVSRDNLFILPSAFNSKQMNKPGSKLFDSRVTKLSPTFTFAEKCADLRLGIIQQLDSMSIGDRAQFSTMSEWMDMSGTIWDTILKYQDIVKHRNLEELMCSNLLRDLVDELMRKNIYSNQETFQNNTDKLLAEIDEIDTLSHPNIILTKIMAKFDEDYDKHQDDCLTEFNNKCRDDSRLKKMNHICDEQRNNLSRLIYIKRKNHEDQIKYHIKAVLTEIKLSESMKKFQEAIIRNVDKYLALDVEDQKRAFEETWIECFGAEDEKEAEFERDETFEDLYSIFKMESRTMEIKSTIYELFREYNFLMDEVIKFLYTDLVSRFETDPQSIKGPGQFIYPYSVNNIPIREMTPFSGRRKYEYLGKDSLFEYAQVRLFKDLFSSSHQVKISKWVPNKCHPLVNYCSGYYNHPDITWEHLDKNNQILLLASQLKAPENFTRSTWDKFVDKILTSVQEFVAKDPTISQGTVKELINFLYSQYKIVNHEIGHIEARLSNIAERTISKYVFAIAFKSLLESKTKKRLENKLKTETKKINLLKYFLQKIENRKMVRGKWDRAKMSDSDQKISKKFARDFLESLHRGLVTGQRAIIEDYFKERRVTLSHERILLSADDVITKELATSDPDSDSDKLDINTAAVQYICNRNKFIRNMFQEEWTLLAEELYTVIAGEMKAKFTKQMGIVKKVLFNLLENLVDRCSQLGSACNDKKAFDSDSNFELAEICDSSKISTELSLKGRESPFRAMLTYLRMYLDPTVSPADFNTFFADTFRVDGVEIKPCDTYILCEKIISPPCYVLDEAIFKKLSNTKMFNSENIFNIHEYITNFLSVLNEFEYELTRAEFKNMIKPIKERFEKDVIGCPSQCPSCGKLCERELHPNDGNCQIKTGHQICSMGGRVWNNDNDKTAVLFMCDDYKDNTRVLIPGEHINWGEFKEKCGNEWNWNLPTDEKYLAKQRSNREKMINIWNKFGRDILQYYLETFGTKINYIPYTSFDEVYKIQFSVKYNICFVIDGTGSMRREIEKARISVGQFISKYNERGTESEFKVVIYRDHCDENVIEMFPDNPKFTPQYEAIQNFLKGVEADGGGDYPEAVLDGLATAVTKCEWENKFGSRNVIIHIYDAPPHGDFPNYTSHNSHSNNGNCCCCNHGTLCPFDWQRDVWSNIIKLGVQYHGINTGRCFPEFEEAMKSKLGEFCGEFQTVGKEIVNDAILQIFIDFETK